MGEGSPLVSRIDTTGGLAPETLSRYEAPASVAAEKMPAFELLMASRCPAAGVATGGLATTVLTLPMPGAGRASPVRRMYWVEVSPPAAFRCILTTPWRTAAFATPGVSLNGAHTSTTFP